MKESVTRCGWQPTFGRPLGRYLTLALLASACVHAPPPLPPTLPLACLAPLPPVKSKAELAWDEAERALAAGRYEGAGQLFAVFANDFPTDPRAPLARIQQGFSTLLQPDEAVGLAKVEAILEQLPTVLGPGERHSAKALRAIVAARRSTHQELGTRTDLLSSCQERLETLASLERERTTSKAAMAKLQQELLHKEQALEEVKMRLLEIQQLAAEMLGAPKQLAPPRRPLDGERPKAVPLPPSTPGR